MSDREWRIFLSYRGNTEGMDFESNLYNYLTEDPLHKQMYGDIYFSPKTATLGDNFKLDVPGIMKKVEYFVMPLTKEYYDDFWDEENDCPNMESITYREISAALENDCKFICIDFPGFTVDEPLLKKLFNNKTEKITCAIVKKYDRNHENELMREIGDSMVREDYNVSGMADFIKKVTPNVFMAFKKDTENPENFPFYQKLYDVKKITLLNYAASSFLTGIDIASIYNETDYLKRWFSYHLSKGNIEADIILTDPHSYAAQDAAMFKMYPIGLNNDMGKERIILHNMNRLFDFMKKYPQAKLNIYFTRIALPYGIMMTEHRNPQNNHIKVDIYAPVTNDDGKRLSFFLLQNNEETLSIYSFLEMNIRKIMQDHSFSFNQHPDISWLLNKPIIHRGVINKELLPHTKQAYEKCLEYKFPIEVDLLQMKDGTIIVARDDQDMSAYGYTQKLSELCKTDLRKINNKAGQNRIFTLEEFLDFISGKVPLLIEIKTVDKNLTSDLENYVKKIVTVLQKYSKRCSYFFNIERNTYGEGFAVHSADPNVLKIIKELDCLIPCGIITKDFSSIEDKVGKEFSDLHRSMRYVDVVTPDFISCDVHYLSNSTVYDLCEKLKIPLIVWTVTNEDEQQIAKDYHCDNIIVEGASNYL